MALGVFDLETVAKYLSNPLLSGVFYAHFEADFSTIDELLKDVIAVSKKYKAESAELMKLASDLKGEDYIDIDSIKESLSKAIFLLARQKECPKEIAEYVLGKEALKQLAESPEHYIQDRMRMFRYRRYRMRRAYHAFEVFESHILRDINDVIGIETEETEEQNVVSFEVTTIKEEGVTRFANFLTCIPHIGDTVKEIRRRKTHSSRYTFRPYPLAVRLWLGHRDAVNVPKDLRDFLRGSIRYHSEEEWRTAIVLSAIAVESVLADLYEEQLKEYAPNVPLGELYHEVKDKIKFPKHIGEAIEMVNEARISAVHRSRFPVSDREAINALYGATTFIMWYSSDYK